MSTFFNYEDMMHTAFGNDGRTMRVCPKCRKPQRMGPLEQACLLCVMEEMNDMVGQAAGMRGNQFYDEKPWASTGTTRAARPDFAEAAWKAMEEDIRENEAARERAQRKQQEQRAAPPPQQAAKTVDLDLPMLRRLLQLCHPDKHHNSQASQTATHFLLGLKDALERSQR